MSGWRDPQKQPWLTSSWVHTSSPQLFLMMNPVTTACARSSALTAMTQLPLAAGRVPGRDRDLGSAWRSAKKNPQLACCGRENRKPDESQSFAKGAGERWQGELSALSSCIICFYYLGDGTLVGKYSLEMPTPSVSWGTQPVYSRLTREIRRKCASCKPKAGSRNAQEQFHHIAVANAWVREKWLCLFWI